MHKKRLEADFSSKKAQVTVFIILGIILILILAIFIAIQQEVVTFKPEELAPASKGKVETFLTTCIQDLGDEALTEIGLQGGYPHIHLENLCS